jgi:hypothetical protein
MSEATILSLVTQFSNGSADPIALGLYYDRLTQDLARAPWFVVASVKAVTANTATFVLNSDADVGPVEVKIVGVFYDDRILELINHTALESVSAGWRDHRGAPIAYTVEDEAAKTYRLYPAPNKPSGSFIFVYGSPLGLDFPPWAVLLLHTESRRAFPDWMDLPAAWSLMAREYGHESRHRDDTLADFSQFLADLLWSMVA